MSIISDNASPVNSDVYDKQIENSLPYYGELSKQIIDIVRFMGRSGLSWLDLGCGTGTQAGIYAIKE